MKTILLLAFFSLVFISCRKDPPPATCTTNVASLSGTYKLTSLKYKATASSTEQDYLVLMDACERDDLVTLNSNGTYTYTDAGTVCSPNGSDNGTWSLSGNTINSDGVVDGTIQNFDCATLVFYAEGIYIPGDRLTFTMTKQ
jgi:hypothetical protein